MDRYQRVQRPREEAPVNENEVRITSQGKMRNYISYSTNLLQQENGSNEIVIKALGRAINKTVMIAELIKRRIVGLHQDVSISSADITDTWEPLEEGLLPVETTRHVSMITITLSKKELDTSSVGYQPPIPSDQVKSLIEFEYGEGSPSARGRGRGGRGRGRARGNYNMVEDHEHGRDKRGPGYGRGGRGRGRGRGFRGGGRGGYGGNFGGRGGEYENRAGDYGGPGGEYGSHSGEHHYDEGDFYDEAPAPVQGQGRGKGQNRGRGRWSRSNPPIDSGNN